MVAELFYGSHTFPNSHFMQHFYISITLPSPGQTVQAELHKMDHKVFSRWKQRASHTTGLQLLQIPLPLTMRSGSDFEYSPHHVVLSRPHIYCIAVKEEIRELLQYIKTLHRYCLMAINRIAN